jgi:hypothetical protein
MEEMWKKFKQETREDLEKINSFLQEPSLVKPLDKEPNIFQPKPLEKIDQEISNQIVLGDGKSQVVTQVQNCVPNMQNCVPDVSRKKVYGSLKDIVKELMQKENVSRAQAYRKAKRILEEKSQ